MAPKPAEVKRKYPHKVSFYRDPEDTARVRGAILYTMTTEGNRNLSQFVNRAVMAAVERLAAKYNNGEPIPSVGAREMPQCAAAAAGALSALLAGCASTPPKPTTALVVLGPAMEFQVEHARTAGEQRTRLADRSELSEGQGMMFSFASQSERQVWMPRMKFPIDIAWIADHRVISV